MIYAPGAVEDGGRTDAQGARHYSRAEVVRRRRLLLRAVPLVVLALIALVVGLLVAGSPGRAERRTVERFATLWAQGDYGDMYTLLDAAARARIAPAAFDEAYRAASETATLRDVEIGRVGKRHDDAIPVAVTVRTRVFGTFHAVLDVPVSGSGDAMRIAWRPQTVFPGLQPRERLTRTTELPPRAALLARDGTVLAAGAGRTSQAQDVSDQIVGQLGPIPADRQGALRASGYPEDALVGTSGLERAFEYDLAGRPGGTLLAGGRVLARTRPRPARAVRTTLDVGVERAAIAALAGRYGGIAAIVPQTGEILALAGVAFSALQPPGSTFKVITLTGALESHLADARSTYPIQDAAVIDGVTLQNANGEYCGGTLEQAFAHSCNSVFAPLGAQLGARRLVDVAERYGFDEQPAIPGAAESTIPSAREIGDDLAVGSSAIGQGLVQATTLQMTDVAATIAMRGRRPQPTLRLGDEPRFVRVTRRSVAREVARMMLAVVRYGTGTAAAIAGVEVAGKTGTAELESTVPPDDRTPQDPPRPDAPPPLKPDAWFVAYAPERRPRIAVGALLVEAGAGGDVAAPAARGVLLAGLQRRR
ncbi:MAG TPA: penicillin-binding transpeptidase domain-containing protein [Conexibacter sp.]|nr:penicillin-binding transpeptidase domain-containing protein [Conexibacter sp.]